MVNNQPIPCKQCDAHLILAWSWPNVYATDPASGPRWLSIRPALAQHQARVGPASGQSWPSISFSWVVGKNRSQNTKYCTGWQILQIQRHENDIVQNILSSSNWQRLIILLSTVFRIKSLMANMNIQDGRQQNIFFEIITMSILRAHIFFYIASLLLYVYACNSSQSSALTC